MSDPRSPLLRPRRSLALLIAPLALTASLGVALGVDGFARSTTHPGIEAPAAATALASPAGSVLAAESTARPTADDRAVLVTPPTPSAAATAAPIATPAAAPAAKPTPTPKATPKPVVVRASRPATTAATVVHRGTNHVWMPSLGIDRSVTGYACSESAYPGDRVYLWGCAGTNNVYLFGHASSAFRPLHDAYVAGRLKRGQALWYADGGGGVHRYVVAWWKVTTPTAGTWAYAAQSSPSVTLQTCLGAQSQYRLIVHLDRAD